jgi:hypothetical protein
MSLKDKLAKARSVKPSVQASKSDGEKTISTTSEAPSSAAPVKSRFGAIAAKAKTYSAEDDERLADEDVEDAPAPRAVAPKKVPFAPKPIAIAEPRAPEQPAVAVQTPALPISAPESLVQEEVSLEQVAEPAEAAQPAVENDPFAWYLNDGDIPQGSAFSLQQWTAAIKKAGSDFVVYEIHDRAGRRLTTMPVTRSHAGESDDIESKIFGFSLVISSDIHGEMTGAGVECPPVHTTYIHREWSYKECPVSVFMVTRSRNAIAKGSNWPIWRNWPKDADTTEHQRDLASKKNNKQGGYYNQQYEAKKPNAGLTGSSRFSSMGKSSSSSNRPRG